MTDDILIKTILSKNSARYGANLSEGDTFEYFVAETVLKPLALTFDQIDAGIVDGKNDGGIDGVYFFVNRSLVSIDTDMEVFKSPVTVDLYVIQAKIDGGFAETAITKLQTSVPQLIALNADTAALAAIYNDKVLEAFGTYRDGLKELASQFPSVNVHVVLCDPCDCWQ